MGKRKLNSTQFYQCDWTGYAMKLANCYMPTWTPSGKLLKRGCYCNWESVLAHAMELHGDSPVFHDIKAHVHKITGANVQLAPHYTELSHTKGTMDQWLFHEKCVAPTEPLTAVRICTTGVIEEVALMPEFGTFDFPRYLNSDVPLSYFHSTKKKSPRDLTVYYNASEKAPNTTASNIFKVQLKGDVLLVQQTREASCLPRQRFVSFTRALYDEYFNKKRKRVAEPASHTSEAYGALKRQMQDDLDSFEQKASSGACPPKMMSKTQTTAPTSGKELASLVKQRQKVVPPASLLAQE